jgi:probable rRNA maturation factor
VKSSEALFIDSWVVMDFPEFSPTPALSTPPLTWTVLAEASVAQSYQSAIQACLAGFERAWPALLQQVNKHQLLDLAGVDAHKPWEADIIFVGNASIQAVNHTYRQKDKPTDVLTFTLFADAPDRQMLAQLPVHHLGSVLVSLDWASTETGITPIALQKETDAPLRGNLTPSQCFVMFILERMIHGFLHLLGVTHDTDQDYNKVVEIQRHVLNAVTG